MKEAVIRKAHMDDMDALSRLYKEFHDFHVRSFPDRLVRSDSSFGVEQHEEIKKIIENDDAVILVAEVDNQLVGLGEAYMREDKRSPLSIPHKYGYLQSLSVTEAFRGRDIGTRLLEAIEQWSKKRGATEIRLDVWEFKEGPARFYGKYGYRTLRRTMVRKL